MYVRAVEMPVSSHYDFRRTRPAPYADAPYFSREFIRESFTHGQFVTPSGTRLVIPKDFRGKDFNVQGGLRRTTDQPEEFRHRVLVFGVRPSMAPKFRTA